ncbi:MAG: hypothetical protein ACR2M4_07890 [Actinomycetota bacterium]
MAVRVQRLEVPWVVLLVAALVPPLAAATVVMAAIAGASATMIKMALWQTTPRFLETPGTAIESYNRPPIP